MFEAIFDALIAPAKILNEFLSSLDFKFLSEIEKAFGCPIVLV